MLTEQALVTNRRQARAINPEPHSRIKFAVAILPTFCDGKMDPNNVELVARILDVVQDSANELRAKREFTEQDRSNVSTAVRIVFNEIHSGSTCIEAPDKLTILDRLTAAEGTLNQRTHAQDYAITTR